MVTWRSIVHLLFDPAALSSGGHLFSDWIGATTKNWSPKAEALSAMSWTPDLSIVNLDCTATKRPGHGWWQISHDSHMGIHTCYNYNNKFKDTETPWNTKTQYPLLWNLLSSTKEKCDLLYINSFLHIIWICKNLITEIYNLDAI